MQKFLVILMFCIGLLVNSYDVAGQSKVEAVDGFYVGEKLTYSVSVGHFRDIAYVELFTVSQGKFANQAAVEMRSTIKTLSVAGTLGLIDQSRVTFASQESSFPLFTKLTENITGLPKSKTRDFSVNATDKYDLLTLINKIRQSGGAGSFVLNEGGRDYNVSISTVGAEKVTTDAGDFDSSIISVQSEYLSDLGMNDFRINLGSDAGHVPVLIRFRTDRKLEYSVKLRSLSNMSPKMPAVVPTPTPDAVPKATPRPIPTPPPYADNEPLSDLLSFKLGEVLKYSISSPVGKIGVITLSAKDRKQVEGRDSLLLMSTVSDVVTGNNVFGNNDSVREQVDPISLSPYSIEIKTSGQLADLAQTVTFDDKLGVAKLSGGSVNIPVGTHSVLSLLYAMRSFNLKRSLDKTNPVNDTRVAVFWKTKANVFILRPGVAELIDVQGEKVSAQLITIITGDVLLDNLGVKVWLANDESRTPLLIRIGAYTAELISTK